MNVCSREKKRKKKKSAFTNRQTVSQRGCERKTQGRWIMHGAVSLCGVWRVPAKPDRHWIPAGGDQRPIDRSINSPHQTARSVLVSNCGLDHNTTHLFQQAPTTLSTCESNALMWAADHARGILRPRWCPFFSFKRQTSLIKACCSFRPISKWTRGWYFVKVSSRWWRRRWGKCHATTMQPFQSLQTCRVGQCIAAIDRFGIFKVRPR